MFSTHTALVDRFDRPLRDLRISVTDRCNFRCTYCMPKAVFNATHTFLERAKLLSFEELERLAKLFVAHGVKKIRLTGGEPLVRAQLERLIKKLALIPGLEDLSMTTNGSLLTKDKARLLKDLGLNRVNISLDALDDATFMAINDVDFPVRRVLEAIENCDAVNLPVKINMVVKRGANEHSILPMARFFHGTGHILRFIEYMDVGSTNGWRLDDVVPAREIADMINAELRIEPLEANYRGEVAQRWRYVDGGGELGIISSVSHPFCRTCTRARLSAEGALYTCLYANQGHDFRRLLREHRADDTRLAEVIASIWSKRTDRYSEVRSVDTAGLPKIEMSYIGG